MAMSVLGMIVLVGVAALYLTVRIFQTVSNFHEPTSHLVRRSPVDRRRRLVDVAVERRQGFRRQDEVASQFLADLAPRRSRLKVAADTRGAAR